MKEIFNFVAWQWKKFEFWQKSFIVSSAFFGAAIAAPEPWRVWLSMVPMVVVFSYMTKWLIWDGIKSAWERYKKEKEGLFDTIKDSDR